MMPPIKSGQYRHLVPQYQKVVPPEFPQVHYTPEKKLSSISARTEESPSGLEPYSGMLTDAHLAHFIKRTRFGITLDEITKLRGIDLASIINNYLTANTPLVEPINNYNKSDENIFDPDVPQGKSFIKAKFDSNYEGNRIVALKCWMIGRVLASNPGIQEKMFLFWWNFFPIKMWDVFVSKSCYAYINMIHKNRLGNFKTFIREVTLNPAMLVFLSGASNSKDAPDENYARELQELFCIGKGNDAKFTEGDVQATAKVLTGWTVNWDSIYTEGEPKSFFDPSRHESQDKQFSGFYNNKIIKGKSGTAGADELNELLDMIFENPEVAKYLSRKLYSFFICSEISAAAESNVITPLANLIRKHNYEIAPAMKALLGSAHFFHPDIMGSLIKSPMDLVLGIWRTFDMPTAKDQMDEQGINASFIWRMSNMGMEIGDPPNVAGWPPYYQAPHFDKNWINTDSITKRANITDSLVSWGFWISPSFSAPINILSFTRNLENPGNPNKLIEGFELLNLGISLSAEQKQHIKKILLSGQENETYWTGAWNAYIEKPTDEGRAAVVLNRLRPAYQLMLQMGETQLM